MSTLITLDPSLILMWSIISSFSYVNIASLKAPRLQYMKYMKFNANVCAELDLVLLTFIPPAQWQNI